MLKTRSVVLSAMTAFVLLAPGLTSAANYVVTITNKSKSPIIAFHASSVGTSNWEEDILGADVLGSGESIDIDINDGSGTCKYDLLAKFDDGSEAISTNLDVCKTDQFDFTD